MRMLLVIDKAGSEQVLLEQKVVTEVVVIMRPPCLIVGMFE